MLSLNLHRRHLTPSQKSMVAARAREHYDKAAKERQKRKPQDSVVENLPQQNEKARDAAGKAMGVSGKSVDFATKVLQKQSQGLDTARYSSAGNRIGLWPRCWSMHDSWSAARSDRPTH